MVRLSEEAYANKLKYDAEYKKKNVKQFKMDLNKLTMSDVIEWLDTKDSKQGYILELIRKDIEKNKK